jgi:hypothetical protein
MDSENKNYKITYENIYNYNDSTKYYIILLMILIVIFILVIVKEYN